MNAGRLLQLVGDPAADALLDDNPMALLMPVLASLGLRGGQAAQPEPTGVSSSHLLGRVEHG
jgi:hypothetical protein